MKPQDFRDIVYAKDDAGIVTLTLNTPGRKNALSAVTFLELSTLSITFSQITLHTR